MLVALAKAREQPWYTITNEMGEIEALPDVVYLTTGRSSIMHTVTTPLNDFACLTDSQRAGNVDIDIKILDLTVMFRVSWGSIRSLIITDSRYARRYSDNEVISWDYDAGGEVKAAAIKKPWVSRND